MTPTQLEHLRLLKAHLETLIEDAKKRAPGKWTVSKDSNWETYSVEADDTVCDFFYMSEETHYRHPFQEGNEDNNATFIASCAGNAEAGWQSTLTAISGLSEMARMINSSVPEYEGCGRDAVAHLEKILAAWPIENLR